MSTISWGIQIDTTDSNTDTNAAIGLYAGYLNWITGRPGYAGSGYSGEAPASLTFKQGLLLDTMAPMVRMTKDMEITGGYGGLSGFNFEVDDTGGLNNTLESNDYFLINRSIDVYCFIDNVSYHVWGGVVSKKVKVGVKLKITCEDDFQNVHKQVPPEKLTETNYPNIDPDFVGEVIPITFGNVLRSKLLPVTGKSENETLGIIDPDDIKLTVAAAYAIDVSNGDYRLNLKTPYMNFPAGYFIDNGVYYIRVIRGTSQSIRIVDSVATVNPSTSDAITVIMLSNMFPGVTVADFNSDNAYPSPLTPTLPEDLWMFEVIKMNVFHLSSYGNITSYVVNSQNQLDIVYFDKDKDKYVSIGELAEDYDTTISNNYKHPNVSIVNNKIDASGEINFLTPVTPEEIKFINHSATGAGIVNQLGTLKANVIDRDRETYASFTMGSALQNMDFTYRVKFPSDVTLQGMNSLYVLFDIYFNLANYTGLALAWELSYLGPYNQSIIKTKSALHGALPTNDTNYLPNEYYKNAGNIGSDITTYFSAYAPAQDESFSSKFLLDSVAVSDFNDILASPWVDVKVIITSSSALSTPNFRVKQIGFVAAKDLNLIQDDIFIKMKGESV